MPDPWNFPRPTTWPQQSSTEELVERVLAGIISDSGDDTTQENADAALTELAERLKAAEKALAGTQKTLYAEVGRTNAAEAQRDELVEALEAVGDYAFGTWEFDAERIAAGRKAEELARAALAKVEG